MARTPLFALVERSLRLARAAAATGRPVAEVVEEAQAERHAKRSLPQPAGAAVGAELASARGRGKPPPYLPSSVLLTRRNFLGGSLALGAGLAAGLPLAGCAGAGPAASAAAAPPGRARRRHGGLPVVIAGAGIAGLTAGYRLRQAGVPVRILEAQGRTGGRMFSLRDRFADRQVVELGGELIDSGHTHIRALAEELCIALDDLAQEEEGIDLDVWWFAGAKRSDREVVEAFLPLVRPLESALVSLPADVHYRTPAGAEALDRMSIAEWLDSVGAAGWFRRLLEVAYTTEYGLEPGEQSALNLILMLDPQPSPFQIFGDSDERFHVRGGNDRITAALAERLADAIEIDTLLEAVALGADGAFRCAVRRGGWSRELRAEHVILALPFTLLRDVRLDLPLPPVKLRAIRELGYGTNAKLMVGFSSRVWRTAHGSNGSVVADLPFQHTWETSRRQPGTAGVLTNFTGGAHGAELGRGTAAEQARRLVADLEAVFPGLAAARPGMTEARFHWPSFAWSRGSYGCYRPGQWTAFAGAEGEPFGNLRFAGEHCSRDAQGLMEGGCETGETAAREVLAALGLPYPAAAACLRQAG